MKRRPLETSIETAVVKKAKSLGYINRKMNGLGFRSWPDRLFIHTSGAMVWIEFKRYGEEPTAGQAEMHKELRERKQVVGVFDTRESAISFLEAIALHAQGPEVRTEPGRGGVVPGTRARKNINNAGSNKLAAGKKLERWRAGNRST